MDSSTLNQVTITIDGETIVAAKGTTIIEAARGFGIKIPHYCYDRDLSIVASCRLCLVEIEKVPKLMPACSTPVAEGQVIFTHSDKVLEARKQQMEFLLVQHPLDCPVCDQGGECKLQEYSLKHGLADTRFRFKKREFPKPDIGPFIDLERNRCILCSRCVRFMDEIAGDAELAIFDRGNRAYISTFLNQPLRNEFTGNTIDLCPVGALTSKITRFRTRVWELKSTPSICTLCSIGCNIKLQHRIRTHEILRLIPRPNPAVNGRWICDIGRFGFDQFNSAERPRQPLIKNRDGKLEPVSWGNAIRITVERLQEIISHHGPSAVAGIIGSKTSNETLFLFQQFIRDILKSHNVDHRTEHEIQENDDGYLTSLALRAANQPFAEVKTASTILLLGTDLPNELPILHLQVRARAKQGAVLLSTHSRPTRLDRASAMSVLYHPGGEAAFLAVLLDVVCRIKGKSIPDFIQNSLKRIDLDQAAKLCGVEPKKIETLAKYLIESKRITILLGEAMFASSQGSDKVKAAAALAQVLSSPEVETLPLNLLLLPNNARGAADMGCYPHRKPGFTRVDSPGKNTTEILQSCIEGGIRALILFNTDLINEYPDRDLVQRALETVPFLVVGDSYRFQTSEFAQVFFPLSTYTEQDGTYTNLAGLVQKSEKALPQLEGTLAGYQVLLALGERWGADWRQIPPAQIFAQAACSASHYSDLSWETLTESGKLSTNPETKLFNPSRDFDLSKCIQKTETPPDFPYRLVRGRFLFDQKGEKTLAPALMHRSEPCVAELHPQDALTLKVTEGAPIKVIGPKGEVELPIHISSATFPGGVTILGNYDSLPLNRLISISTPWVRLQR